MKGCRLPHVDRAGQLRKQAGACSGNPEDPEERQRPVDAMEIEEPHAEDEDDVSSEDLDEELLLGRANDDDQSMSQQANYIRL